MKRLVVLAALIASTTALADTPVCLDVSNLNEAEAQIIVSVFESKKTWLKKPVLVETANVIADENGKALIEISLPPGDYAFHIFVDVDKNGKMKTNFIGIPKEPTGVSNDAKGKFGPPKFKDAVVSIGTESTVLNIKLAEI